MKKKVIIVDIDGTLYPRINTLYDFSKWYWRQRSIFKYFRVGLSGTIVGKVISKLVNLGGNKDLWRDSTINAFNGANKEDLEKMASQYVQDRLRGKESLDVVTIIDSKISDGFDVWLVSGTISEIVSAISLSASFKVDFWLASELEWTEKGGSTGRLKSDIKGQKLNFVNGFRREGFSYSVITDNKDDLPMVLDASESWILSSKKNFDWWKVNSPINARIVRK
ncbi:MAG: haloacid dehalogenase-like hydrolase [Alteromonadaceae bacterium]|nr:haloacid dehalogenase-like hydrolase [Alteromonadaceae bacterium]